jgi:hypothetical protein
MEARRLVFRRDDAIVGRARRDRWLSSIPHATARARHDGLLLLVILLGIGPERALAGSGVLARERVPVLAVSESWFDASGEFIVAWRLRCDQRPVVLVAG